MRILITGVSGFIGSNVLEYMYNNTDWDFVALCSWRHKGNPLNLQPWINETGDRIKIINHDLIGTIPELGEFDYILNIASESHVDRSIANPIEFTENNISSMLQVLEYARKHPPKIFLQFSTDEVYGAMEHKEWDILLPSNPYAASKAAQEMICIAYWKTYKVPIIITNSNNIVGKNQDKEKFLPKIIELINSNQEVTIHISNGKPGRRYWNAVENVSDALLFILNTNPAIYGPNVDRPDRYALSGGMELDNLEMAQLVAKLLNKDLKYKFLDAEIVRPGYDQFYANTVGELDNMGWKPVIGLEESLAWVQ